MEGPPLSNMPPNLLRAFSSAPSVCLSVAAPAFGCPSPLAVTEPVVPSALRPVVAVGFAGGLAMSGVGAASWADFRDLAIPSNVVGPAALTTQLEISMTKTALQTQKKRLQACL